MVFQQSNSMDEMITAMQTGRMTRRSFLERATALGLSSSAAAAFLAACGGSTSGSNGPVTLTLWDYFNPAGSGYLGLISGYTKANPSVKIQRTTIPFADLKQKLIQGAASGQLPDIAVIDNPDHTAFADLGVLTDLTTQISTWGQTSQYFPGPLKSTVWKGKNYGLPNNSNCLALYYNKDMFSKAGLTPPTTLDELHTTAQKLTKPGVYGLSMSLVKSEEGTFQFLPFLWSAGADLNTIDSPAAVGALTRQGAQFKWGVVSLPKGAQSASILGGENWAISKTSRHVKEAWDFLKWTQQPAQLRSYIVTDNRLPSTKTLAQDAAFQKDQYLSVFVNSLEVARPRAYGPKYPQVSNAVQQAFQSAISGQMSASAALSQAAQTIKPLLG